MFQLDTRILLASECLTQMTSMSTRCIDSFQGVTCSIGAFNSSEVHAFFEEDWRYAKNFTMTTARAGFLVYSEIFRIISGGAWSTEANSLHNDGAVVEVGVWKGGSSMLMALAHKRALPRAGADYHSARQFYLFDTFDGLPAPGEPVLGARSNTFHCLPLPSIVFHRHLSGEHDGAKEHAVWDALAAFNAGNATGHQHRIVLERAKIGRINKTVGKPLA